MKPTYAVKKARPPAKAATEADLLKDAEEKDQFQPNWVWNTLALNAAGKKSTHHSASGASERPSAAYITGTNGAASGSWSFNPNGTDTTLYRKLYFQFSVYYPRETLGYRYLLTTSATAQLKVVNFGQADGGHIPAATAL